MKLASTAARSKGKRMPKMTRRWRFVFAFPPAKARVSDAVIRRNNSRFVDGKGKSKSSLLLWRKKGVVDCGMRRSKRWKCMPRVKAVVKVRRRILLLLRQLPNRHRHLRDGLFSSASWRMVMMRILHHRQIPRQLRRFPHFLRESSSRNP